MSNALFGVISDTENLGDTVDSYLSIPSVADSQILPPHEGILTGDVFVIIT